MKKFSKVSDVVASQVPSFMTEEYPAFVAFLEGYYKYLETQKINRNIESFRDIDTTLNDFVSLLKKELAHSAPNYSNNRLYLPLLKQHFVSRGSEESFKLLFRLLYNKDVEVQYPKEQILKVSDGKWQQDNSIFVQVTKGDVNSLLHKFIYVTTAKKNIRINIERIAVVDEINNIYELFFGRSYFGKISVRDRINYNGVSAVVLPTTTGVRIVQGGRGFKIGQVFTIDTSIGSGTVIKVTKIDANGGIREVQKINFGIGYKNSFYYTLSVKKVAGEQYYYPVTSHIRELPGGGTQIIYQAPEGAAYRESTEGFIDSGFINTQDYYQYDPTLQKNDNSGELQENPFYSEGDYVGEVKNQFYSNNVSVEIDEDSAIVLVTLGAVAVYPGFYSTNDSFVSGLSYIQDGDFYQDFSYLLRVDEKLDTYKNAVLQYLHPVGRKLFGEYSIQNSFELTVETVISVVRLQFPELLTFNETVDFYIAKVLASIFALQDAATKQTTKALASTLPQQTDLTTLSTTKALDSLLDPQAETTAFYLTKPLTDSFTQPDSSVYELSKPLYDSFTQPDSNTLLFGKAVESILAEQTEQVTYSLSKPLDTIFVTVPDESVFLLEKPLSTFTDPLLETTIYTLDKYVEDFNGTIDSNVYLMEKPLDDTFTTEEEFSTVLDAERLVSNTQFIDELTTLSTEKPFAHAIIADTLSVILEIMQSFEDEAINIDSGTAQLNPYYSEDYFLQDYQEGRRSF